MEIDKLRQVILDQQELFQKKKNLINREIELKNFLKGKEVVIISGIRRCGKSSLLRLLANSLDKHYIYFNFDDIRLTEFNYENFTDFEDLVKEIKGLDKEVIYLLDEVQNANLWEKWVNNLQAKGIKVFVTGSNSKLLSSEISTFLTGRKRVIKLYPFSFKEFLRFKNIRYSYETTDEIILLKDSFNEYFEKGGFPQVLEQDDLGLSKQYFDDILTKDIIKRYNIRAVKELNDLVLYLFSNIGKPYSYSTLKQVSGIKSLSIISGHINSLKEVFLAYTINRFDYSLKKQKVSSSKFYSLDNSFLKTVAFNFSENLGQRLENLVLVELVRRNQNIYYHLGKHECDFVIKKGLKIKEAIQVCVNLGSSLTKEREFRGLIEALEFYRLKEGLILTREEEFEEVVSGKKIIVKPVWKWLLESAK